MVLQVARIVGVTDEQRRIMGVGSGLELVTLPHGSQLRQDLLERYMQLTQFIYYNIYGRIDRLKSWFTIEPCRYPSVFAE